MCLLLSGCRVTEDGVSKLSDPQSRKPIRGVYRQRHDPVLPEGQRNIIFCASVIDANVYFDDD